MCRLRPIVIIGSVLAGVKLLSAAGSQPSPAASPRQLTEADAGRLVELRVGDKLVITLPGNPTTGFQWKVAAGDPAIVRPSGGPEFEPAGRGMGSAGKLTLRFDAAGAGQTGLKLIYHRPFEKDTPPAKTFEVTVNVK
jgi:inhibitor of cysteine peptidase